MGKTIFIGIQEGYVMMADRANMKLPPELLERFNDARGGKTQAAFLEELLDMHEGRSSASREEVREIVRGELQRFEDDLLAELRGER